MTTGCSVASIAKAIGDFSDQMTIGMKKTVRRHFREYLLGMMIPPEIRRKSISNISSLVSLYDQSTLNRAFHAVDPDLLERNHINLLKSLIGDHRVQFIGDDTLLEHPGASVMESVGWFHDRKKGKSVMAHQPVTSLLYDMDADRSYPFLIRLYRKIDDFPEEGEGDFRTKLQIMKEMEGIAHENFNVAGKTVDSWYSAFSFLDRNFVTELKANRKVSLCNIGPITRNSRDMFLTMDEILETTFVMFGKSGEALEDFPLYTELKAFFTNGDPVNLIVLYNPGNGRKKFLASDYLHGDELLQAWNNRWPIETFHNDAKDLGMGEYQVRDGAGSLIHGRTTIASYTLLSMMIKASEKFFGKIVSTIGECSRAVKERLILKRNYKWTLFSG